MLILLILLLYISYKDIKEAEYSKYCFYSILIILSVIAKLKDVSYIRIVCTYIVLLISYVFRDKYVDYIGDGDIDLYIAMSMIYTFEQFLYLVIISTLSAIFVNIFKNRLRCVRDNSVRLVPYITFAFIITELLILLRSI